MSSTLTELLALRRQLAALYERRRHLDRAIMLGEQLLARQQAQLLGNIIRDRATNINIDDLKRQAVLEALRQTEGHRMDAAKLLGVDRAVLYRLLAKYGIGKKHGQRRISGTVGLSLKPGRIKPTGLGE